MTNFFSRPAHRLARPLAALGLLLATAGAAQAQTATFALQANPPYTGPNTSPYKAVIADVNADGLPDALLASSTSSTVVVLLGNGAGGFTLSRSASPCADSGSAGSRPPGKP